MKREALLVLPALLLAGCAAKEAEPAAAGLTVTGRYPLEYAEQFTIDECAGGYSLVTIGEERYLVVPEDAPLPTGLEPDLTILQQPIENIYLVSTSVMDPIISIGALDSIALSGTQADGWYLKQAREAMENGRIAYAGRYSTPDYETILTADCGLAIENTMIYHTPEVIEQLQTTGVPVLVERSSYESSPLGRIEWLKLYGALVGKEDLACSQYDELLAALSPILDQEASGQTIAFFYINSSGAVNVRKSGDYIAKAIAMAGGQYVSFDESGEENALSTMTIQMESFYASAVDADIMIYNSTIDGEIRTIDELLTKSPLLADCKAVQEGSVWCITKNFYQESLALGDLILDVHAILQDKAAENLHFLRKLS